MPLHIPSDVDLSGHPTRKRAHLAFLQGIEDLARHPGAKQAHVHWLRGHEPVGMNDDGWILITHPNETEARLADANEAMVRLGHRLRANGLAQGVINAVAASTNGSGNAQDGAKTAGASTHGKERQPWERQPVYMPAFLVATTLPHSDPKTSEFTRVNGKVRTTLVSTKRTGLPFGVYPRLLLVQLATSAVRTKGRRFPMGKSINDLFAKMGISNSGGGSQSTLARDQLNRLCTTSFVTTHLSRYGGHKLDVADQWLNTTEDGLVVELSERFWLQSTKSAVPLDPFILRRVRRSPLSIDVYGWITYRLATLKEPTSIAWPSLESQFGAEYKHTRQFRRRFGQAVDRVKSTWPGPLGIDLEERRVVLYPGPPSVATRNERSNAKHG